MGGQGGLVAEAASDVGADEGIAGDGLVGEENRSGIPEGVVPGRGGIAGTDPGITQAGVAAEGVVGTREVVVKAGEKRGAGAHDEDERVEGDVGCDSGAAVGGAESEEAGNAD